MQPGVKQAIPLDPAQPARSASSYQLASRRLMSSSGIFRFTFLSMLGRDKLSIERSAQDRQVWHVWAQLKRSWRVGSWGKMKDDQISRGSAV